jgi:hypothetical protein
MTVRNRLESNERLATAGDCEYAFSIFMSCLTILYSKLTEGIFGQVYKGKVLRKLAGKVKTTFHVATSSEHCIEPSDPVQGMQFLERLSDSYNLKIASAPWS